MKKLYSIAYLFCFFMHGCALYQKPVVPCIKTPNQFKYAIKVTHSKLKYNWWENFNDAKLNKLVNLAIANNYNYKIAIKNVEIAHTYVTQNESYFFPQVNLNFNSSRNKSQSIFNTNNFVSGANTSIANNTGRGFSGFGRIFNLQQLFASVSYELDVWNQIGNTVNQAKANVGSSAADSNIVKLTLISSVVNTYFQIRALDANLSNLRKQSQVAKAFLHLNKSQYRGKLIEISGVDDAKNQIETIKINIKNSEKQKEILTNALAYLLGLPPEEFFYINRDSIDNSDYLHLIPAGIPAKMIANRPDIQSAYFQVLSYGYFEKQNIANFLPTFNLTGNYGYANTSFSKFFTPNTSFWNYGLSILQPIFDYQLRMSEYKRSKYQLESAILNYKNTVINAFQEVNNALLSYEKDNEILNAYQNQVKNLKEKLNAANAQYQSGYGDYSTYLNYKLSFLQNKYNLTNQQLLVLEDIVQVYKTLGLGLCV